MYLFRPTLVARHASERSSGPSRVGARTAVRVCSAFACLFLFVAFASLRAYGQTTNPSTPNSRAQTSSPRKAQEPAPLKNQAPRPSSAERGAGAQPNPVPRPAAIMGTVTDASGQPIPGATVTLRGAAPGERQMATTDSDGFFEIDDVKPGIPFHVTVSAEGFAKWKSSVTLQPGQPQILTGIKLHLGELRTTVTVSPETTVQIATAQVRTELKQRGLGVIPNFYEVYESNPAPLTPKLKLTLALKDLTDPITVSGVGLLAGIGQAGGGVGYEDGAEGFGHRFSTNYYNQITDIMIGGAILPIVLHQDPRYFYKASGSKLSRALHAISAVFIAKGDNGHWQPNYSSLGGDLASAAISNLYYPQQNRGVGLVFENFGVETGVHMGVRLLQEFVFRPGSGKNLLSFVHRRRHPLRASSKP